MTETSGRFPRRANPMADSHTFGDPDDGAWLAAICSAIRKPRTPSVATYSS